MGFDLNYILLIIITYALVTNNVAGAIVASVVIILRDEIIKPYSRKLLPSEIDSIRQEIAELKQELSAIQLERSMRNNR